jgi:hypothetical protein
MNFALLNGEFDTANFLKNYGGGQFVSTKDNNSILHLAA